MKIVNRCDPLWLSPFGNEQSKITEPHLCTIIGWLNDPEVVKYSEHRHRKHNKASQWEYLSNLGPHDIYWGMWLGKRLIGTMTAYIDNNNQIAEMAIMIGEKTEWGKGHGFEAWQRMGNFLLGSGIRKLEAGCMGVNNGMLAICQKFGMVEEGRREDHFKFGDKTTDLVYWGKFNETV